MRAVATGRICIAIAGHLIRLSVLHTESTAPDRAVGIFMLKMDWSLGKIRCTIIQKLRRKCLTLNREAARAVRRSAGIYTVRTELNIHICAVNWLNYGARQESLTRLRLRRGRALPTIRQRLKNISRLVVWAALYAQIGTKLLNS